jgi:serine/threonine-protein kinase
MSTSEPRIGAVVGGHRIEEQLGRGATGVVYRAVDVELGRTVALKLVHPELAGNPHYRMRFTREVQLVAGLDHPNVIHVWRSGDDEGAVFLSMELVEGPDLGVLLADGPMAVPRALAIVADIAAALDVAHAGSVVHRDVKPQNVLIRRRGEREQAVLTDFGFAKVMSPDSALSTQQRYAGIPAYTAPEQLEGRRVDARTDVYALGCVLFEALTGELPFPRAGVMKMVLAHVSEPPPTVTSRVPGAPPLLDEVLGRALSKRSEERYASAGDLARAAGAAVGGIMGVQMEGSVATGRAAPVPLTPARDVSRRSGERATPRRSSSALARVREREQHRAAVREAARSQARYVRVSREAGISESRRARLSDSLRPDERATAAAMCSRKGESVDDILLLVTTRRVLWSDPARPGAANAIEAERLRAVTLSDELTIEVRGAAPLCFSSWRADGLQRVGAAVQALIDGSG